MADVRVFVDDAVLGRLPGTCVKEGVATTDRLLLRTPVGDGARLGALWLLLFAGPLGWIAFFVLSSSRSARAEVLSVELPFSAPAFARVSAARRSQRRGTLLAGLGVGLFLLGAITAAGLYDPRSAVLAVCAVGLVIVGLVTSVLGGRAHRAALVGVELDASRRWVTISGVHHAFAAAVAEQRREGMPLP